ncbi:MAG: DUF1638 domain-containing protein [Anaerolineales bacterium]
MPDIRDAPESFDDTKPLVVIACRVFQGLLERYIPAGRQAEVTFLDYGLHRVPKNLTASLQEQIDAIEEPSLILLGYGLCGNGLNGIQARQHTLIVPKADDCIAILLGSRQAYREQFNLEPGTYYLTKGWLESGSDPLKEYHEYAEKYGEEEADWLMDQMYRNYRRLVFVAHEQADLDAYRSRALEVARYCERWGMRYGEIIGSDGYIARLAEAGLNPGSGRDDFLLIPPGGEIRQADFLLP